jgi:hypothetical protein
MSDDSHGATDEDEDSPELDLELIEGPSIALAPPLLATLA